jgi:High potential iron-sulfur protein
MYTVITLAEFLYNPFWRRRAFNILVATDGGIGEKWLSSSLKGTVMERKISRRVVVKNGLIASALLPIMGLVSRLALAAGLPALDPADPTAKSLGFVTDASKAPNAKPNQKCATCMQFQGKAGDADGGCNIFAGKSVPAAGWCMVWVQKT